MSVLLLSGLVDASWIGDLVDALVSPAWFANFIQSILATAIAFAGALLIFRRQLGHDRKLQRDQFLEERAARDELRQAAAAHQLGHRLIEASRVFETHNNADLVAALEASAKLHFDFDSMGVRIISDAEQDARLELDLDKAVLHLWRHRIRWWRACVRLLADPALTSLTQQDRLRVLYGVVESQLLPNDDLLEQLGRDLLRWNGAGLIPTIEETALPAIARDRETLAAARKRMHDHIAELEAKKKPS